MRYRVVSIALLLAIACSGPSPEKLESTTQQKESAKPAKKEKVPEGPPGFATPAKLCGVLASQGLQSRGWRTDAMGGLCSSDYRSIGDAGSGPMATNLAFYVEGPSREKAELAKLVLNVNNPQTRNAGLTEMADAADALFAQTSFEKPPALRDKILKAAEFTVQTTSLNIKFSKEQSKIVTFRLEITSR